MATYHIETDKGTFEVETDEPSQTSQSFRDVLKQSAQKLISPLAAIGQKLQPKNLTSLLPAAGMMAGTAMAPGLGTGIGAGLGSIAQKMADLAYGTAKPVEPTTSVMGIPMAPKEAIWPAVNAATAGLPATQEGQAVGNKISQMVQSAKPGLKKSLQQVEQMLSGKSAAKVGRLINDPSAYLPISFGGGMTKEAASNQYANALEETGLKKPDFGPFKQGHKDAEDVAQSIYDKWKAGGDISAQEAFSAKRATDKLFPAVVKERNAEDIKLMSEFKTAMDDVLSNQAGPLQKASQDYARASLKADFRQILPRTKTGDISTVKTLLLHTLAPKRMLAAGLTSPTVFGAGNVLAQGAMKGLNVLGKDPAIRQTLIGLLQQMQQKAAQTP